MAATTKPKPTPNDSAVEVERCESTLKLLTLAIQVQRGVMAIQRRTTDAENGVAVVWLTVTLGEKAPTTKAIIVNGELFITALDAGAASTRERSRLLAVARAAGNA